MPATTTTSDDPVHRARAYLLRVAEPPALALTALVAEHGPVQAAAWVRAGTVPGAVLDETSARRHHDLVEQDLAAAHRAGARLIGPEDEDEWPTEQIAVLADAATRGLRWAVPPLGLWVRGPVRLADLVDQAISVVGARAATGYGEHVAAEFGYGLAGKGITVVSGAAYGIDGAAHRGALASNGATVAVLGCGIDVGYPSGHTDLLDRIAGSGLVISEYPPGTPAARHRFLVRNRLIALSAGTVVVEAGVRSGSRNTAASAAALGKEVMAVPGPITSAMSAGCHDLLRAGTAIPVSSVAEILESVGQVGHNRGISPDAPVRSTDGLADQALRVHEALTRPAGRSSDRIAVESGVPLDRVRALLPELELTGLAERCDTGWRLAVGS